MADETKDSLENIIEQITCKMLLHDDEFNNLDNKNDEQKAKRGIIRDKKMKQIIKTIDSLCRVVKKQLPPNTPTPVGLEVLIAKKMLLVLEDKPTASIEFAKVDPIALMNEYNIPVQNNEYKEQDSFGSIDIYDELVNNENNVNNNEFMIIQPEDSRLAFTSEEAKVEAENIENNKHDLMGMIDQINNGTMMVEQLAEFIDSQKDSNDTIIDSLMEATVYKLHGIKDLKAGLELVTLITSRRQEADSKFRPDNYTYRTDMELIGQILELKKMYPDSPEVDQMLEKMREVNETAVEFMERNPNIFEELRAKYGENFHITELGNTSEPHSVEEMENFIFEYEKTRGREVKEHDDILPGLEEQEEIEQPEEEQERPEQEKDKTQLTMEEKMENFKKNMLKMAQAKGAAAALKFANNLIMNRNDAEREALTSSVIEVVAQEEFIQTAKEDDLDTIREIIGSCLDEENKKQNSQLIDYVQALGGMAKDIKDRTKLEVQDITIGNNAKNIGVQQPSRDNELEL